MIYRKFIMILSFVASLVLGGCLPAKMVIALPEDPMMDPSGKIEPERRAPSEEQLMLEKLIRQLEETEQRLLETQRKAEEALKKVEKASEKTDEAVSRIIKTQEKIEAIDRKENP